ncbi:MAG: hypothetical protein IKI23_01600 [Lachnospiraceae bacterium]|jgi:hypothetical protein|nr:hypothetical protein [Lachnospiraceae bacterium]
MKINQNQSVGRVLFIVEGSRYEFNLLKRIFVDIFHYEYIQSRRNGMDRYISGKDRFSRVAVINTRESNIRDISENNEFLDDVFRLLLEKYDYPVDQSAVYYVFDRDPESNTKPELIRSYIEMLKDPYDNEESFSAGLLLLSYPSIESYTISCFQNTDQLRVNYGKDVKAYISGNPTIQLNKIDQTALEQAASDFIRFLKDCTQEIDIDNFSPVSRKIFDDQEIEYLAGRGFRLFSMLTLAFLQMGIIEL